MKCKYCLHTNVVKNGYVTFEQQYKCRNCNKYFTYTGLDQVDPEEIQHLLSSGIHRYAIARKYGCTHTAINRYIKKYNLIESKIIKIEFNNKNEIQ